MNETAIIKAREYIIDTYPEIPIPAKSYLVLFSPRTGSTLLSGYFTNIGYGNPIEAFNAHLNYRNNLNWGIDYSDPYAYFKKAFSYQTVNGVLGMKISYIQFKLFLEEAKKLLEAFETELGDPEIVEVFLPQVKYIFIRRRNKIRQAISLAKAGQNGIWAEEEGQDTEYKKYLLPTVYDRRYIEACLDTSLTNDVFWEIYLKRNNLPGLTVFYEDLVANYVEKMGEVYTYLGIGEKAVISPLLRRQSNQQSKEWETRFIAETPWLKDPGISKSLHEDDVETAYFLRCRMIIYDRERACWHAMPINRFKTFRVLAFRVKRKLASWVNRK